jgi:patatin-like phospholipase/acyl hydrolase
MPAKDILAIYMERGDKIFPPRIKLDWLISRAVQWTWHLLRDLRHYRYDRAVLAAELERTFQQEIIGNASCRLVIPSFDEFNEVTLFKTPHHPDYKMDWKEKAADVALSTSAAPTFSRPTRTEIASSRTAVYGATIQLWRRSLTHSPATRSTAIPSTSCHWAASNGNSLSPRGRSLKAASGIGGK